MAETAAALSEEKSIICPYCFHTMRDDEVHFRSDRFSPEEMPEELSRHFMDYDDVEDFQARYEGPDKDAIIQKVEEWEFFKPQEDPLYRAFWEKFGGGHLTSEFDPADRRLGIEARLRRVIDPKNPAHQRYLRRQNAADGYFLRSQDHMVAEIQLSSGELCDRRVCPKCHNPLPANYGRTPVKFITVIGITASGKTVWFSQLLRRMRTYAQEAGLTAMVASPSVANFIERNAVEEGEPLPGSTPGEQFQQPLFFELIHSTSDHQRRTETIVLYDVGGEIFDSPYLVRQYAPFILRSSGILLLIDPDQFKNVQDADRSVKKLVPPAQIMQTIYETVFQETAEEKCDKPTAVCITKMDKLLGEDSPDGGAGTGQFDTALGRLLIRPVRGERDELGFNRPLFNAREYQPILDGLNQYFMKHERDLATTLRDLFSDYAYFSFSALGCGTRRIGEDWIAAGQIIPKRIEEPLLWLFYRLGFIGTNAPIVYPYRKQPIRYPCPRCGAESEPLPGEEEIRYGFLKMKVRYVDRVCTNPECGHKF